MKALYVALAIAAGLSNPVQSAANAGLNKALGNPVAAAAVILGVSATSLLLVALVFGLPFREAFAKAGDVPWWGWIGGACGLVFIFAGALAAKQIGSGAFTVTTLVTAVVLSILLDHFGLLGLEQRPATWLRLAGGGLAIGGVVLVALF